ncbi:MAG: hypothetical protein U0414_38890 [Polyangiaceae bacterium]
MSSAPLRARSVARALLLVGLAVGSVGLGGCSGGGPRTADEIELENRNVDARLQGSWRIGEFKPDQPLGPVLDDMLAYHQQQMIIHFGSGRMWADSPGISFDRRYQVQNAMGDRFQIVAYDDTNTPQLSYCDFEPDGSLRVWMTSPWKGVGTLVRASGEPLPP